MDEAGEAVRLAGQSSGADEGAAAGERRAEDQASVPESNEDRTGVAGRRDEQAPPVGEQGRKEQVGVADESSGEEPVAVAPEREAADVAALRDQLLRLAAEFDNYRKRANRERVEAWGRAKADLIEKLLGPIDDLHRVAHPEAASMAADSQVAGLLAGVELVERKLMQILEREGLQPIDAEGAVFDPEVHEAVLTQPTADPELDGRVESVIVPGYRFADRLLRPAQVVVWKLQR